MAFCPNCGSKLTDDAKFCPECGTKVEAPPSAPADEPLFTPPTLSGSNYTYSAPADAGTNPPSGTPEDTGSYTPPYTPANTGTYTYTPAAQNTASSGSYSPEITRNTYSYDPAAASPGGTQPPRPPRDIPGGSQPQKKKSSFLPFLLIAIGVAALVFLLIGLFGGDGDTDDPAYGVYVASYGTYAGSRVEIEDMWPNGFSIELLSKNKCRVMVDGETETCRYELESDGEIEIDLQGDEDLEGWLVDNRLTLEDVMDFGVNLVFYKEGTAAPAVKEPAATEAPVSTAPETTAAPVESAYSWWDGNWYGWWVVYDAGGEYADIVDSWADVCATIRVDGDTGLVDIWDDTCEEGENLGYIDVTFKPGKSDKGRMLSESGYFLIDDINSGDWIVDPADSIVSRFDQMIYIRAKAVDPDDSGSWIDYMIFLRPWGMSWEDVRNDSCEDMPYTQMMPYYYDDWYVPHMNGTMPEYFDFGDETT